MSNLLRVTALAFAVVLLGMCFPFFIGMLIYEGSIQTLLGASYFVGLYPFLLTVAHATRIELFIARDLKQPKRASAYAKDMSRSKVAFLYAHNDLLSLLSRQSSPDIDRATYEKGLALARRHRCLASLVWWGIAVPFVAAIIAKFVSA